MIRRLFFAALFLSLAWTTVPSLATLSRDALRLRGHTMAERRAQIFGPFYDATLRLRRSLPRGETVALVMRQPSDVTPAVLFNYYVYPLRTRLFSDLRSYRQTEGRPRRIIRFDHTRTPEPRQMRYEDVRAEDVGSEHVSTLEEPAETMRSGIVPIVASVRGPSPDDFRTEAVMVNASSSPARVTLELYPINETVEMVLGPHERRTWTDFVYEVFDRKDQGWLRFRSDSPVRARFWFVDRGRRQTIELPYATPVKRAIFDAVPGSKLWLLNPNESSIDVVINGGRHTVPALHWAWYPTSERLELISESGFVAYLSSRDSEGKTRVTW